MERGTEKGGSAGKCGDMGCDGQNTLFGSAQSCITLPTDSNALSRIMKDGIIEFAGKAIVPIAVITSFALARKYFPVSKKLPEVGAVTLQNLDERFRYTQWIVGIAMLAIGGVFAWSVHAALVWLNRSIAVADSPQAVFRLWPQTAIWWFLPGIGAITLCWELTFQLWSRLGNRETANAYYGWSSRKAGFDSTRVLRWMALLTVVPIGIVTLLALSMHTTVREHDIHTCGYAFGSCETFRYSDARRMTLVEGFRDRNGKLIQRAGIVLDFTDGRRWSSADTGNFSKTADPAIVTFLIERTRLQLEHAQTGADIPKP